MNKAVHVLVYVFLVLAVAALYFELQLSDKKSLLTDRNRMQEDYLVSIAKTIEKADAASTTAPELKVDVSPVEAKIVDSPDMENVLEEYKAQLEQPNLETYNWDSMSVREQLRQVYVMGDDGKPVMDGSEPLKRGSPEDKLLTALFESAKKQQARLNTTRAELVALHGKLEKLVTEINTLKPAARQDKLALLEKQEKITKLEGDKAGLENQVTKKNAEVEELNTTITSLRDEVSTAKDELEAEKEKLAKSEKLVEQLKKLMMETAMTQGAKSAKSAISLTSLTAGNKGKVIEADNDKMFAVVELTEDALAELKGPNKDQALPILELGVRRTGFNGDAGEFVGRIRLRQEVKGKPYVICDILSAWEQDKLQPNDIIFAD